MRPEEERSLLAEVDRLRAFIASGVTERVRDVRGYDIGYTATCAVHDWTGDLRERPTQSLIDIEQHLTDTREPTP